MRWEGRVMCLKQCHKPPMTGNSLYNIMQPIYCMVIWGMVYGIVLPTIFSMAQLNSRTFHQVKVGGARDSRGSYGSWSRALDEPPGEK